MNKSTTEITGRDDLKSDLICVDDPEVEPHYLSELGLLLYIKPEVKPFPTVPPSTPKELISDCYVTKLPKIPASVEDIEIPFVRECGIRDSIAFLAKYFNCEDYRNNLVQFWFLDMLVDCIWRAQDEFRFPLQEQKVLLEWILFVMHLITNDNMTKTRMFEILNEALVIAQEYVQSEGPSPPIPKNLFTLKTDEDAKDENNDKLSFISVNNSAIPAEQKPSKYHVIIKLEDDIQIFTVQNDEAVMEDCLSSSIDPPSENELQVCESTESDKPKVAESESSLHFYKPDMSTPPRFKSLQELEVMDEDFENTELKAVEECSKSIKYWLNVPRNEVTPPCPSKTVASKVSPATSHSPSYFKSKRQQSQVDSLSKNTIQHIDTLSKNTVKSTQPLKDLDNEKIFKIYYDYNMWQLKNEYMADPNIGWTPSLESYKNVRKLEKDNENKRGLDILGPKQKAEFAEREKKVFVNLCVLMAAKQMVFEYFDYSFSFELAKISLKYPQYLITQDINTTWNIPKDIRGDLKKPVPKKPKKEKVKKEKPKKEKKPKNKKDASSKKSKSTKGSKGKKKGKDKGSKSDKKSKSSKKSEDDKKVGREGKKEIERLKKEQAEIDRRKAKEEENKRFMFPLKDAVDDVFFTKIFPDFKSKKGGKKGEKGSKSSKSDKSSKSAKKGKKSKK